jgi:uncharacterized membrane protein YqgA involved in biofilm formation
MIGLGTIINAASIVVGGLSGMLFGKLLRESHQESLRMTCGISAMFIGIAGAMEGMLTINNGVISSGQAMLVTLCLALGTLAGEIIDIEHYLEKFAEWLKLKTGNAKDSMFVNAFVTASLTVCIGAMAIVGAIQDGITGNWSILATKAILDFIIIMVMTSSLGKGCIFSAIPVLGKIGENPLFFKREMKAVFAKVLIMKRRDNKKVYNRTGLNDKDRKAV